MWKLPEKNHESYEKKEALLLWYCNEYLPMAAGHDDFGPSIRNYKMVVDKRSIDGVEKVCVTIPSEAFGWVILANCREKWVAIFEFKKANPNDEVPPFEVKDNSTHVYHTTQWSDSRSGQIKGGGWHSDAYTFFNACMTNVNLFRQRDKKAEWGTHALAKELVRQKNKITDIAKVSKRKRQIKDPQPETNFVEILQFDFED